MDDNKIIVLPADSSRSQTDGVTNAELHSANVELLSGNLELQNLIEDLEAGKEELVINKLEQPTLFDVLPTRQLPAPRKHNRLTAERMIDILADVCQIEDKELRLSLTNKLMGGVSHG